MRIVHVAPTPFGSGGILGGGERYPLELCRALAAEVECELITFGENPGVRLEPGGPLMRRLRPLTFLGGHPAHAVAPELIPALAGADLLHTHHMRSAPSRLAALAGRTLGQRVVVTDHGLQGGDWAGLLPRLFHRFLTVSEYSARELRAPRARTRVIYGGADPVRFSPDPAARREGVLFVGRITPHKGIDRLISALPPGAALMIAGSGGHDPHLPESDYPGLLERMAAGQDVRFLGPVTDSALPELYRSASVLALPSVHRTCYGKQVRVSELLGLVVLEAMASGTPVVCSRLGGIPEVVQDGVTGFLVEPGNVDELRDRLAQLLRDGALAGRLGRNARDLVMERFTWRACAERCLSAYQELLGTAPESGTQRIRKHKDTKDTKRHEGIMVDVGRGIVPRPDVMECDGSPPLSSPVPTHPLAGRAARARALHAARAEAFGQAEYVRQESFATAGEMLALARTAGVGLGTRVLELCCGPGGPALHLATTLGCRMIAVDSSIEALVDAREAAKCTGDSVPIRFLAADALRLPLAGPFDAVLLFETMLSIRDKDQLLSEVRRVLRPGGSFALTLEEGEPLAPEEIASIPEGDRVWLLTEVRFRDMLESAGFQLMWREDLTAAHSVVANWLLRAYRALRQEIETNLGEEGYEELVVSHERWVQWLESGRVRKLALVAARRD